MTSEKKLFFHNRFSETLCSTSLGWKPLSCKFFLGFANALETDRNSLDKLKKSEAELKYQIEDRNE